MTHPIVDAYVAAVNAADVEATTALFAVDGRLENPFGTFTGHDEVAGYYRDVVFAGRAVVAATRVTVADDVVTAELEARSPLDPDGGVVRALDVFRLAPDGRIASLVITYP